MSRCRSCDAEIMWVPTADGERMPIDIKRNRRGKHIIDQEGTATVLTKGELAEPETRTRFMSHRVTCPKPR